MIAVLLPSPALDVTYLLDAVEEGSIHRPREVLRLPGGKGLNLARAAAQLGERAAVVAALGGHTGALVAELARAAGVELHAVPSAAETRSCITAAAGDDGRLTEFYEPSGVSAAELDAAVERLARLPDDGWTVVTGSVPAGADLDRLAAVLRGRSRVALDTHGEALRHLVGGARPALVKVNLAEAAGLVEAPDAGTAVAAIRALGVPAAVVTDGARGAAAADPTGAWIAAPHPETGRFPVGSGDSFLAGLLVGLGGGGELGAALELASAAGAANAQSPGAARFSPEALAAARAATAIRTA
ncbi:1-phosphofructokinase family hexose kinase [Homoserinibacter sp. YIM 151385]|uniref:1-phosphofructokinase family hexose kinase n=1 Tax=Homoserinibacter sp. YIM 151385 TaxID=2985506 RepID=UPI0022F0485E|nr:PfkB family carbohydrate kinase [Homoserinibacter sp. YIM 151385]WBU36750.1 PfkB family carbohydrate kinase [Homoserinibacter sp. YIM 151385]